MKAKKNVFDEKRRVTEMARFRIMGRDNVIIGNFKEREDRDNALRFVDFGIPVNEE